VKERLHKEMAMAAWNFSQFN